jgi:type I restriction enzyme M protein
MVMLADSKLRSQVDSLWDKLWSGGLSNPLDAIEQLSFLFFLKQLDEREQDAERSAKKRGKKFEPLFADEKLRWSYWSQLPGDKAITIVKEKSIPVFEKARREDRFIRRAHGNGRVQNQQSQFAYRGM